MALSGDQNAVLNLVLVRKKTPGEVADLLGVEHSEVETRITEALEALVPGDPPLPPTIGLYLVGSADPIARADAASTLDRDPELAERAKRIRAALEADFPEAAGASRASGEALSEGKGARPVGDPDHTARQDVPERDPAIEQPPGDGDVRRKPGLPDRRLLSILVSAAGLIAVVAAVVLLFGGDDGDPETDVGPTEARLSPLQGEAGTGSVEFGFSGTNFAANVSLSGLERNRSGESYALWLDGPVGAFPVERVRVGKQGSVAGQAVLNEAIICFIASDLFTDLKLARSSDSEFRQAVRQAVRPNRGGPFPEYTGKTVLAGRITMPADTRATLVRECGGRTQGAGNQGS